MALQPVTPRRRWGFTLVELLVVIAIVGVLITMLLPAVQSAREAARRTSCRANLHQLGLGLLSFHDTHRKFPHGGWGRAWVGVPERGVKLNQPGGWAFQLLPFLEEGRLFELGRNDSGTAQAAAIEQRLATPLEIMHCPSRRSAVTLPVGTGGSHRTSPRPAGQVSRVARGDYAINSGSTHVFDFQGPGDFASGDSPAFWQTAPSTKNFTGISHLRRSVGLNRVTDGASQTLLIGEKFLAPRNYQSSESPGDNDTLTCGYDLDNHRFVANGLTLLDALTPQADNDDPATRESRFGSAHPTGLGVAYCDGSVQDVAYDVAGPVWIQTGDRRDGETR